MPVLCSKTPANQGSTFPLLFLHMHPPEMQGQGAVKPGSQVRSAPTLPVPTALPAQPLFTLKGEEELGLPHPKEQHKSSLWPPCYGGAAGAAFLYMASVPGVAGCSCCPLSDTGTDSAPQRTRSLFTSKPPALSCIQACTEWVRHQSLDGIKARRWEWDGASGEKQSWPPCCSSSVPLSVFALVLKLLVHNTKGGEEVPQEEDEEGEAAHENLGEPRSCEAAGMDTPPHAAAREPPLPATPCTLGAAASGKG